MMLIPSILLIEDDEIDAEIVRRAFAHQKIANPLLHAIDGIDALDLLRGQLGVEPVPKPYIILLDINMPRMNGIEFLRELRQDPTLRHTVIFVLTTSANAQDRFAAYEQHVAGYILKENVGQDFVKALQLLEHYQTLVVLPD